MIPDDVGDRPSSCAQVAGHRYTKNTGIIVDCNVPICSGEIQSRQ